MFLYSNNTQQRVRPDTQTCTVSLPVTSILWSTIILNSSYRSGSSLVSSDVTASACVSLADREMVECLTSSGENSWLRSRNRWSSWLKPAIVSRNYQYIIVHSLRKLFECMNTRSRVRQCATVFSILNLFNYPLNEPACPPVSTVYSPIMPSKGIYTLMRVH